MTISQLSGDGRARRGRALQRSQPLLLSHAIFGHRDIHYLDVCAFGAQDEDLAVQLRDYHRRQLDERIRQAGLQV